MAESQDFSRLTLPSWAKDDLLKEIRPELKATLATTFFELKNLDQHSREDITKQTMNESTSKCESIGKSEKGELEPQKVLDEAPFGKSKKNKELAESKVKEGVNLLLLGKTGNGKSATGNSILKRVYFQADGSCDSVTQEVQYEMVEYNKRHIKIVDGPGVGDTHHIDDVVKATQLVMAKMKDAVLLNPDGYNAFLLVIKYGNRLTAEDKE